MDEPYNFRSEARRLTHTLMRGCGDNSCQFGPKTPRGGMGTNGGCRCGEVIEDTLRAANAGSETNMLALPELERRDELARQVCNLCGGDGVIERFSAGPDGDGDGPPEQAECPYLKEAVRLHPGSEDHETYLNVWRALDDLATSLSEDIRVFDQCTVSAPTLEALARAQNLGAGQPDVEEER